MVIKVARFTVVTMGVVTLGAAVVVIADESGAIEGVVARAASVVNKVDSVSL